MIQPLLLFYAKLRSASAEAIIKDNQFLQVPFDREPWWEWIESGKPIKQRTMSHGGCGRFRPSDYRTVCWNEHFSMIPRMYLNSWNGTTVLKCLPDTFIGLWKNKWGCKCSRILINNWRVISDWQREFKIMKQLERNLNTIDMILITRRQSYSENYLFWHPYLKCIVKYNTFIKWYKHIYSQPCVDIIDPYMVRHRVYLRHGWFVIRCWVNIVGWYY